MADAGSDELRTVAFFRNAALVCVFDEPLALVGSRVLMTPPPDAEDSPSTSVEAAEAATDLG